MPFIEWESWSNCVCVTLLTKSTSRGDTHRSSALYFLHQVGRRSLYDNQGNRGSWVPRRRTVLLCIQRRTRQPSTDRSVKGGPAPQGPRFGTHTKKARQRRPRESLPNFETRDQLESKTEKSKRFWYLKSATLCIARRSRSDEGSRLSPIQHTWEYRGWTFANRANIASISRLYSSSSVRSFEWSLAVSVWL